MPQIAQQDYILIPILDGGQFDESLLTQEIQNRLVQYAEDGRALDVVFVEASHPYDSYVRPFSFSGLKGAPREAWYHFYDVLDGQFVLVRCKYREITDEPEHDAQ